MTAIAIYQIKVGSRFRKDLGNVDDLVESIREVGLLHPIVVDAKNNLIAGDRRLQACTRLGMKTIEATVVDLDDDQVLRAQDDENTVRKPFTPTEARAIRDARLAREKEKAKERVVDAHAQPGKVSPASKGRAKDKAAEGTGYSSKTLDKVAEVEAAAIADPELAPIVEEMDRTRKVEPAYRNATKTKSKTVAVAARRRHKKRTIDEAFATILSTLHLLSNVAWSYRWKKYRVTPEQLRHFDGDLRVLEGLRGNLSQIMDIGLPDIDFGDVDARRAGTDLEALRAKHGHMAYWAPVWNAITDVTVGEALGIGGLAYQRQRIAAETAATNTSDKIIDSDDFEEPDGVLD